MLHMLDNIKNNTDHPHCSIMLKQQSVISLRLLLLLCKTERYTRSFMPASIGFYNKGL